jgi:hypothetical protein
MNTHTERPAARDSFTEQAFAGWAEGYGVIRHSESTQVQVRSVLKARPAEGNSILELLRAADRIANAAMWLVVHQTYARRSTSTELRWCKTNSNRVLKVTLVGL